MDLIEFASLAIHSHSFTHAPRCPRSSSANVGKVGLVMEYCSRGDLRSLLRTAKDNALEEEIIWAILYQIGGAIEHIHQLGFIHRDIKPHNIMVAEDGDLRVGDLGIVKDLKHKLGHLTRTYAGTPAYLAVCTKLHSICLSFAARSSWLLRIRTFCGRMVAGEFTPRA
mmetsp:Transcript_49189/g.106804  ORF Transcript_49189/g.106804 Transcript_49189/m.106804 type:complete len:168 (+) Transcript_49189:160-663(+)